MDLAVISPYAEYRDLIWRRAMQYGRRPYQCLNAMFSTQSQLNHNKPLQGALTKYEKKMKLKLAEFR
jgi:hypothetical protein